MAVTMLRRSPPIRVMSEAAIATSVPVPMAMPRSAWASAGASLMPSPTIATTLPSACSALTLSAFCSGSTSASTWSMPTSRAIASAVARLSPVSIQTSRPSAFELRDRLARLGLQRVGDRDQAGGLAVDRDEHRRRAVAGQRRRRARPARRVDMPISHRAARLPSKTSRPSTRAWMPWPANAWKCSRLGQLESELARAADDRLAERVLGADLGRGGQAQQLASRSRPSAGDDAAVTAGLPRVSVPVLSSTIVSMRARLLPAPRRRGSGCRTRRPCRCRP